MGIQDFVEARSREVIEQREYERLTAAIAKISAKCADKANLNNDVEIQTRLTVGELRALRNCLGRR